MHGALFARLARLSLGPVAAVLLAPALAVAQLTVQDQTDPTVTPTTLAQTLGGVGVTINTVTYAGTTRS
jgi:hypothetical protein